MNQEHFGIDEHNGNPVVLGMGMSGPTLRGWVEITQTGPAARGHAKVRIPAALKEIRNLQDGEGYSLRREVMLTGRVGRGGHPCLASFLRFFYNGHTPVIATELVEGRTLKQWVEDRVSTGELNSRAWLMRALEWTAQVASGLELLESLGIVHRDIKPSNIIIRDFDQLPVLIDFGVGKQAPPEESRHRTTISGGGFVGTLAFASPEQFCPGGTCETKCDPRCRISPLADIYGLGSTLWYCLVGRPPFFEASSESKDFQTLAKLKQTGAFEFPDLPDHPAVRQLLSEMLAPRADRRPTARALRERIGVILDRRIPPGPDIAGAQATSSSRLETLPQFASIGQGKEIATSLLSRYTMAYWSQRDAERIDFDHSERAHATWEEAREWVRTINQSDENLSSPWSYRLPTVDEWFTGAGFARRGGRTSAVYRLRQILEDAGRTHEWCDGARDGNSFPECRKLCYLNERSAEICERHQEWPKGAIRLVREPRMVKSQSARDAQPKSGPLTPH